MPKTLIFLLALANLVLGTGAFVVTSIVPQMAQALGVSVPVAGQAMSAYALSTAVLAPLMLVATGRWPRRRAMLFSLSLFAMGNVVCALAPSLAWLLAGRVLMGMGAMFTPVAAGMVVALTPPSQHGKTLAFVFLGIGMSYVIGLPLGTWMSNAYGWQSPIWVVAVATALVAGLLWRWAPRQVKGPGASFAGLGKLLARPEVAAVLVITMLYFMAIFVVMSYVAPVLTALVAMAPGTLGLTLMLFGVSGVVGTLVGGAANDRFGARPTLNVQLCVLAAMMLLLPLTTGHWLQMLIVMLLWGTAGFGMMAPQQSRLAGLSPAHAPLLLSLNSSMLYVGTALGAACGGLAAPWLGFSKLSWAGAPLALAALAVLWLAPQRRAAPAL